AFAPRAGRKPLEQAMSLATKSRAKPAIAIAATDHEKLVRLAEPAAARGVAAAEQLLAELDRARVVGDSRLSADIVRMGSVVTYATDTGERRTVTLVYPGQA